MISLKDYKFFHQAVNMAQHGEHRVRVGAIAVVNGKRIAGAFNSQRNLPSVEYPFNTYHAELNCMDMIPDEKIIKATMYVARISRTGKLMPSKPCQRCTFALNFSGRRSLKRLVYFDGKALVEWR